MLSNRFAFAALGVACIGAAAAGGYFGTRQNTVPTPAAAQSQEAAAPAAPSRPVQETEAVVPDATAKPASPAPAVKSATPAPAAKRVEPAAHPAAARDGRMVARQEPAAPLPGSWPGNPAAQQPPAPVVPPPADLPPPPAPRDDRTAQEPPRAPEPPQKVFEELVVPSGSVIGLQTENRLTSETAHVEDRIEARVTRDVRFGDRVAIPAGTRVIGSVMQVDRGGKFKEAGKLGVRFNTLVLADGTRVAISTDTIIRSGDAPGNSSAAKVGGGAVVGTILGAMLGGSKGAAIGGAAGAGAGAGAVSAGDRSVATLPAGTTMTVRILSPITITTEK